MKNHPHILSLQRLYESEVQSFRKVHRMIDLFESIIKSHTVVIMSEYVKHNQLSESAKGLLSQGLRLPSLGTWQLFSRVLFEELEKSNYSWLINDFAKEFSILDKALNNDKTNVISFRNGYAHGATPTDEQCEADIEKFESFLNQLLEFNWLNNSKLEEKDGKVFLSTAANQLSLHPLLLYRNEENVASFAFFNDIKNDKIGLLNYPLSKHYREKDFYSEFHSYLPLHEWKKSGNNEFYQRIEELTDTFKGRIAEREKLLHFVINKNKGYLSIQGNPGIGKSALIAQFFKDLKAKEKIKNILVVEYFIRRGTMQAQVEYLFNYLIKRTDELFPLGKEIRAEGKMIFDLQYQLFSKWRLWAEHSNGNKLLFLIDGLDEGTENNIVTYMPRENFENILIIYGSRPGGHKTIDEFWGSLPVEHHTKIELAGLSKEDIRALIYEVANKYEVERESIWIDAVQLRSQGNPLYLKLLCNAIENGSIGLNDINALPKEIDEYYKAILQRYGNDPDGDALLAGLYAFGAAKDYLTLPHIGSINNLGEATLQRIGSTLKEVLYENPLTTDILDYQLFHESFREYLEKEKKLQLTEAVERIIDFCSKWHEYEGTWEQRYALEFYAQHLCESKKAERSKELLQLLEDKSYTDTQKKVLRQFDATKKLYQLSLLKANELKIYDLQLEAALSLVDLKYEEENDAPQIINMVANGDIDLALKRIESFGGVDKEGVKRKFMLYMLCLMELTLLNSKDQSCSHTSIKKILQHLDEQLPTDNSILDWSKFFSSYLMFKMACKWNEKNIDYSILYKRSNSLESNWISGKGPYNEKQFEVLTNTARNISDEGEKSDALTSISSELAKQGKIEESLNIARGISDERKKSKVLIAISSELAKQGKLEGSSKVIEESLNTALGISDDWKKSGALTSISSELAKQEKIEDASKVIKEALNTTLSINNELKKSYALKAISSELAKQGKMEEALNTALSISVEGEKSDALTSISSELAKQGKIEASLNTARSISDEGKKSDALKSISSELAKLGKIEESYKIILESLNTARGISVEWKKSAALTAISSELAKQGKVDESLNTARGISDEREKSKALIAISSELAKQGKKDESSKVIKESLNTALGISDDWKKSDSLTLILSELAKQEKIEDSSKVLEESLNTARGISDEWERSSVLVSISSEMAKKGKVESSLNTARGISDEWEKSLALFAISIELASQGKEEDASKVIKESLNTARGISDERDKIKAFSAISSELASQGKEEEASKVIKESLYTARGISDGWKKSAALTAISSELAKQGKIDESLNTARGISDEWEKSLALIAISSELALQGKKEESSKVIKESLNTARGISDDWKKSDALIAISSELAKQGKIEESYKVIIESLNTARCIKYEWEKKLVLTAISSELAKQGKIEESLSIARGISNECEKSKALIEISSELVMQSKEEESSNVIKESLNIARGIINEWGKSRALIAISSELAKHGNLMFAEKTGLEISQIAERHKCWKKISLIILGKEGYQKSLQQFSQFQNDEARLFFLKGLAENVSVNQLNSTCINESLPIFVNDVESIENLLKKFAFYQVFFEKSAKEKIQRLNRTLNIQWALDIIDQFPKDENNVIERMSTNLEEWINQITDEDDREQIELWAKQVAKGKITEEDFMKKIEEMG
jgi:hypothetical protein